VELQKNTEILSKKVYRRPSVQLYGTLSQMTGAQTNNLANNADGALTPPTRT
jgi:hypothetical protein